MTEMNETNPSTVLPGQERYVAPLDETPLKAVDSMDESAPASNMWADAWRTLRKNPLFIISGLLIIFIVFVALFPSVLTKQNPNYCTLDNSLEPASSGHPFGFDLQGCDVYSRVVYGTRTSLSVGVFATLLVVLLGTLIGAIAGFFGGWVDAVLSRLTDIFLALPILLGAIVVLQMFKTSSSIWKIILVMTLFGWTSVFMRLIEEATHRGIAQWPPRKGAIGEIVSGRQPVLASTRFGRVMFWLTVAAMFCVLLVFAFWGLFIY